MARSWARSAKLTARTDPRRDRRLDAKDKGDQRDSIGMLQEVDVEAVGEQVTNHSKVVMLRTASDVYLSFLGFFPERHSGIRAEEILVGSLCLFPIGLPRSRHERERKNRREQSG